MLNYFHFYYPQFRKHYEQSNASDKFERYLPAYRYGYTLHGDPAFDGMTTWAEIEPEARTRWESENDTPWDDVKDSIRHAWESIKEAEENVRERWESENNTPWDDVKNSINRAWNSVKDTVTS